MRCFVDHRTVRFGECDPAGVVYYPVFFNWYHELMEAWFEQALGMSYSECIKTVGFPAKTTQAEFFRPCAMGEKLTMELYLSRLTKRSMTIEIDIKGADQKQKAHGYVVCVCIGVSSDGFRFKPREIPENLHEKMKYFLQEGE